MYTDSVNDYNPTLEALRFCYQEMLKYERCYQNYVMNFGYDQQAARLYVSVKHYQRNCTRLQRMIAAQKAGM